MESLDRWANAPDAGEIKDPSSRKALNEFVSLSPRPSAEKDDEKVLTLLKSRESLFAHLVRLEHH